MSICMSCGTTHSCADVKRNYAEWREDQQGRRNAEVECARLRSDLSEARKYAAEFRSQLDADNRDWDALKSERDSLLAAVGEMREALEAVTPLFEKIMMSCGPFKEDIQVLQLCTKALASPLPATARRFEAAMAVVEAARAYKYKGGDPYLERALADFEAAAT